MSFNMNELIIKKRDGGKLDREEIAAWISGCASGDIPDYQSSAMLMAIYFNGLDRDETFDLTESMRDSGDSLDFSDVEGIKVDKHSTGGVGDKVTLIASPIAAAAGVPIAKMSGRGLGCTGGTADKLASIPGFKTELPEEEFIRQVDDIGIAIVSQSGNLTPVDKKLYALRDVTGTVDNLSLIASSIMSKKLALGSDAMVIDVKCGSGAFFKTEEEATKAAKLMMSIGAKAGRRVAAVISSMDQPLGSAVGNSLEVMEAIDVLKGRGADDITRLSNIIAAIMIYMGGRAASLNEAESKAADALLSGKALAKFRELVAAQGGDTGIIDDYGILGLAAYSARVVARESGFVGSLNAEAIGISSQIAGAGRKKKEDNIDPHAGAVLLKKVGDSITKGEEMAIIFGDDEEKLRDAVVKAEMAYEITENEPKQSNLIKNILGV